MDKLKKILFYNNYHKNNSHYQKNKKLYISVITLVKIDEFYVNFIMDRVYKKTYFINKYNEKRKISKFLNLFEGLLKSESNMSVGKTEHPFCHCEIYCHNCEDKIENNITYDKFCDIDGFIGIHGVQYGKCIMSIDTESGNIILNNLNKIKFCSDCTINFTVY